MNFPDRIDVFNPLDNEDEMADAVGDLMVYCLGLCEMMKISSDELLEGIVEKNRTRTHTGKI